MRLAHRALIVVGAAALIVPFAANSAFSASGTRSAIGDSVPGWTHLAKATGATSDSQRLSFNVVLNLRNQSAAEALAAAVSDPSSTSYGHYLTAAQFNAQFGPTASQVAKVSAFLKSAGIKVDGVAAGNRWVEANGTVGQINAAFGTEMKNYSYRGKNLSGPSKTLTVPSSVSGIVGAVVGISSEGSLRQPMSVQSGNGGAVVADSGTPNANLPTPSSCSHYWGEHTQTVPEAFGKTSFPTPGCGYSGKQLRVAYGVDSAVSQGNDGSGVTVGIIDAYASPTIAADTDALSAMNGEPTFKPGQFTETDFGPFGLQTECGDWSFEEAIDVQSVHGLAPGANIHFFGAQDCDTGIDAAINYVIQNHSVDIVSNSYGFIGEDGLGSEVATEHSMFLQAALEGIGFYFSSGDFGDNTAVGAPHPEPDYPASDPLVTSVGGTTLGLNSNGSYSFETTWGNYLDPVDFSGPTAQYSLPLPGEFLSGGGGGVSALFKEPAYQKLAVPSTLARLNSGAPMRVVPDVAALADPETGFIIDHNGGLFQFGGTSLACPIFAGIQALASQGRHAPIGFANPLLYTAPVLLGGYRDIKDPAAGSLVYATNSGRNLLVGASDTSLTSVKGYDDATGLGTPNGAKFLLAERF
jgi:subtilase family serine protease